MNQENFDNIIQQKANAHEAKVPPDAWDNIIGKKRRRWGIPFFWWSLSCLVLGSAIFVYYLKVNPSPAASRMVLKKAMPKDNAAPSVNEHAKDNIGNTSVAGTNGEVYVKTQTASPDEKDRIQTEGNLNPGNDNNKEEEQVISIGSTARQDKQTALHKSKRIKYRTKGSASITVNQNQPMEETFTKTKDKDEVPGNKIHDKEIIPGANLITTTDLIEINETGTGDDTLSELSTLSRLNKMDHSIDSILKGLFYNDPKKNDNADIAKWKVEASISPFLPFENREIPVSIDRTIINTDSRTEYVANSVKGKVGPNFAYNAAVVRSINSKISLGLGFQYARLKETLELSGIETTTGISIVQRLVNGDNGPYLTDDTVVTILKGMRNIKGVNQISMISIPVFLRYSIKSRRSWALAFNGGFYFMVSSKYFNSINGQFEPVYQNGIQFSSRKKSPGIDLFAGLRLSRAVGKKFQLFAEPTMRFYLSKYETSKMLIRRNINQAGISFGVSGKLGR